MKLMREKRELVELDSKLARRSVNEGFSGGEKKRIVLDFQGIMLVGDVYLNGKRIGGTDYGYLGFDIDLKHSENVRRWWPFLRDRRILETKYKLGLFSDPYRYHHTGILLLVHQYFIGHSVFHQSETVGSQPVKSNPFMIYSSYIQAQGGEQEYPHAFF